MSVRDLINAASGASAPSDPYSKNNTLLLNGDGTNGAQNNTFLDSSTNNFTITRNGNTTQGSFSPYGSNWSNYFNGSSGLTIPYNSNWILDANFTIEGWIFPTGTGTSRAIIGTADSGGNSGWDVQWTSTNTISARWINTGSTVYTVASSALSANTWHHFAFTLSGTTLTLYVNGTSVATTTVSGSALTTNYTLGIGQFGAYTGGQQFIGYISNARYVKGSVVYTGNFTPPTAPLTAITNTKLLTCQSNRFIDNSSNAYALTVVSAPQVQRFSPFNPTAPYSTSVIGGSGYFDGSGDYLTTPSTGQFNPTGDFTVSCWFNLQSFANSYYVLGGTWNTGTADEWLIQLDNAGAIRFLTTSGTSFSSSGVVKLNCWNYFAAVRSGSTITVYLNGTSLYSYTLSGTPFTASKSIRIGMQPDGSWPWNGYISDFKLIAGSAITTVPTSPQTNTTGTSLLLSMTNAGIPDLAMMNDLETVGNAQVSTSVKKYGTGSLAFDGSGDYLSMPSSQVFKPGSGNWTVECWVYLTNTGASQYFYGDCDSGTNNGVLTLYINSTAKLSSDYWTSSTSVTTRSTSASVSYGQWVFVSASKTGTTLYLGINGTVESFTAPSSMQSPATIYPTIGRLGAYNGGYVNGYIDDFRFTNGVARYTANFTPPTAALPTY